MNKALFSICEEFSYHALVGFSVCEEIIMTPQDLSKIQQQKEPVDTVRTAGGTSLNITTILTHTFGRSVKLVAAVDVSEKGLERSMVSRRIDQHNIDWHPLPILDGMHLGIIHRVGDKTHKIFSNKRPTLMEKPDEVANQVRLSRPAICIASGVMPDEMNMVHAMFTTKPDAIRVLNPRAELVRQNGRFMGLLEHTDLLIVNHLEFSEIIGEGVTCETFSPDDVALIHQRGCPTVIVTCSMQGAMLSQPTQDIWHHQPAIKPTQEVDPTGAGDSFTAGVVAAILNNQPHEQVMKWGAVVASLNIARLGGTNYPAFDEFNDALSVI